MINTRSVRIAAIIASVDTAWIILREPRPDRWLKQRI